MVVSMIMFFTMLFQQPTVYDFSFTSLDGKQVNLADFKGKQLLIVNTASKCGFTKQYKELQELHEQYGDKLVVIGFPSDNFGGQEFADNQAIAEFCEKNFGVNFILAEKSDVKGEHISPLFKYLTSAENPDFKGDIKWNFEKFLIGKDGKLVHRYRSKTNPMDAEITKQII
ncbi:glutathione peroxidase [Sphingobacterium lactis]|uniref:Glutathione peroxidase n=1 Tax=Sphingobacterium lactis TaxID=797291 RepID=A0A1H6B4A6_9SPHI|nr:glutathione peroxidase [Sphingobacterium lactis]SEG55047.1 glutathione peroxidase [Sphingobacterium lactis]